MRKELLKFVQSHIDELDDARCMKAWGNKEPIPSDCADRIYDLCEEFSMDNDMPEGWWLEEFDGPDDVFYCLSEIID